MRIHFVTLVLLLAAMKTVASLLSELELRYYEILESSPADDIGSIEAKYRRLAKEYHPDSYRNQYESTRQMTSLNEAYDYVLRHKGAAEGTLSTGGAEIFALAKALWQDIPREKKIILFDKIDVHSRSNDFARDVDVLTGYVMSLKEVKYGLDIALPWIMLGIATMSIGLCTVAYCCYRVVRCVLWLAWRLGLFAVAYRALWFVLQSARKLLLITLRFILRLLA
jgi:hypothetical protein